MTYKDPDLQRKYQREWQAKRRADFFAGKVCAVCQTSERLELDHIDPSTKESHAIWSWALPRREAELAKCQVLCREHHQLKTAQENQIREREWHRGSSPFPEHYPHGTDAMYSKYGCRCDPCVKARSIARNANRARRKALNLPRQ